MASNIINTTVTPVKPKVLADERIFVYVPEATTSQKGIATYNQEHFNVTSGRVSIKKEGIIGLLPKDPLEDEPSLVRLLDTEFEHADDEDLSLVKLKRTNLNAFEQPELVQLDSGDFNVTNDDGHNIYSIKANNPKTKATIVKIDNDDFGYSNGIVDINWPIAKDSPSHTNGYGLMKIPTDGYLKYDEDGNTDLDYDKILLDLDDDLSIRPLYGTTAFPDYTYFVDPVTGLARIQNGAKVLKIDKESIGLSKVANKAFNEYVYNDFGTDIKNHFTTEFNKKLNVTTWNNLFSDWQQKTAEINTPHKWFLAIDSETNAIWDTLRSMGGTFLGVFGTEAELISRYPATNKIYASTAFVAETDTYWAIRPYLSTPGDKGVKYIVTSEASLYDIVGAQTNDIAVEVATISGDTDKLWKYNGTDWDNIPYTGGWEWYDTEREDISFYEAMETRAEMFLPNSTTGSAGNSGKWAQSNHVHPSDPSKLNITTFQPYNLTVTSNAPSSGDFEVDFWQKEEGEYVPTPDTDLVINIPYVRTAKYLHNIQGSETAFTTPNNEAYWAGSAEQFADLDIDDIPDNSLIVVDDGEGFVEGEFVSEDQLAIQGLPIDAYSNIRAVVINRTNDFDGLPVTVTTNTQTNIRQLNKITLLHPDTPLHDPLLVSYPLANGNTIKEKYFTANRLLKFNTDGTPIETDYIDNNVITTARNSTSTNLTPGHIAITDTNNTITTFNSGTTTNALLVSNGAGGIKVLDTLSPNKLVETDNSGLLKSSDISLSDFVTGDITNSDRLIVSTGANELGEFDTGSVTNRLIVSDGDSGIKMYSLPQNKLVVTDNNGSLIGLTMTSAQAGYYVGVSEQGTPTLIVPQDIPTSLPVKTLTSNPATAQVSTVLVFADPQGNYRSGCLYLY